MNIQLLNRSASLMPLMQYVEVISPLMKWREWCILFERVRIHNLHIHQTCTKDIEDDRERSKITILIENDTSAFTEIVERERNLQTRVILCQMTIYLSVAI